MNNNKMKKNKKFISFMIISVFILLGCNISNIFAEIYVNEATLAPNVSISDSILSTAFKREKIYESHQEALEAFIEKLSLPPADVNYLKALYEKFSGKKEQLVIGENFEPSARLTEQERKELLGAVEYSELKGKADYAQAAEDVMLICNTMDGGLGSSVLRLEYLREIWKEVGRKGEVAIGAKGQDLYFDIEIDGVKEKVSITEMKFLQALSQAEQYSQLIVQELVNEDSEGPINEFLDSTIYLLDRINQDPNSPKRTYREIISQTQKIDLAEQMILQASLPTIDLETNELTTERTAPGGHGQLGSMALQEARTMDVPKDKVLIRAIYNGDGPNNFPDNYIVGYMVKNKLPIVMITTEKTRLDKKGGQIGVQTLANGKQKTQIMELAQAKQSGQEDLFYQMGLPSNDAEQFGQAGEQYFNTNIALINVSVLKPFLQELYMIIGEEEFAKIVTPDLIKNVKKQSGKEFTQLEGAMASALLNLNGYVQTTDNKEVLKLLERSGIKQLLYIVNVDAENRNEIFTPVKFSYDFWFLAFSDHFRINPHTYMLENIRPGHLPAFNMDDYYKDVKNCIDALGNASTIELDSLNIKGKVHLKDAVLKGNIEIVSEYDGIFDLADIAKDILQQDRETNLVLNNVKISINKEGQVSIILDVAADEMDEHNKQKLEDNSELILQAI